MTGPERVQAGFRKGKAWIRGNRQRRNSGAEEEYRMLLLIAAVVLGVFLFSRSPRLEEAPEGTAGKTVHAFVDGKPVESYLKEE